MLLGMFLSPRMGATGRKAQDAVGVHFPLPGWEGLKGRVMIGEEVNLLVFGITGRRTLWKRKQSVTLMFPERGCW